MVDYMLVKMEITLEPTGEVRSETYRLTTDSKHLDKIEELIAYMQKNGELVERK